MEIAKIIVQILAVIITAIGIFQKEKWKIMVFHALANLTYVVMWFVFGETATAFICIVAVIKNITYMILSYKKIKPNWIVLAVFLMAYTAITVLQWKSALNLLPLIAMLASNYGAWQDNILILRLGYIINGSCYVIYKLIVGAYISLGLELITLTCSIICFIYYNILKKQTPIMQVLFGKRTKLQEVITSPEQIEKIIVETEQENIAKNNQQENNQNENNLENKKE